jgi:integrase
MAEKLSEKFIKNLAAPESGNRIVYDEEVSGFGIRVTAAGAKSFVLNYRTRGGKERRYTIGTWPDFSVIAARDEARGLRVDIKRGIDPLEVKQKEHEAAELERGLPTFATLASDYLEYASAYKREHSLRDDRRMLQAILLPRLGSDKVAGITGEELSKLHQSLKATPYQANRVLALLSAMFTYAVQEKKWRADNPAKGVRRYHEDRRKYWLPKSKLDDVIAFLDQDPKRSAAQALLLIIYTGARKSEVLSANWQQFDLEHGIWTKPAHSTKQHVSEQTPLSDAAITLLQCIPHQGKYLFPGKFGDHLTDVKNLWEEVRREVKIPECRIHDLRHTFASHLVTNGVSLYTVGRLLGHRQPGTTARYSDLANEALRDAANRFGNIVQMPSVATSKQKA